MTASRIAAVLVAVFVSAAMGENSTGKVDRADLKSTIRGLIPVIERSDFRTYMQDYTDPGLLAETLKFLGKTVEQLLQQSEEVLKKNPDAGKENKKFASQLTLALTMEPKYDETAGVYYFDIAEMPKDLAFKKIDGKFYVSLRKPKPAGAK